MKNSMNCIRISDKPTMLKLIDTLRTVTAGKIYVENERARLTHRLSLIHEADDNITEAAKIMQELQVKLIRENIGNKFCLLG